jgi:hypothetical protein
MPSLQRLDTTRNLFPHPFHILEHLIVPKPENGHSPRLQPKRPAPVASSNARSAMLTAIDLNSEAK